MKSGGLALTLAGVLALLVLAKFMRPEPRQDWEAPAIPAAAQASRNLAVTVELSRAGVGSATATLFAEGSRVLSRVLLREGHGTLEIPPEAREIGVESPGHVSQRQGIPEGGTLHLKLAVAGKDSTVFQSVAPRPSTEGPAFCALRFTDASSGELLRGVRVYLDGLEAGESSSDGEVSVPFERLRKSKNFAARQDGYKDITLDLNEAVVDELHVEPLLMTRRGN